MVVDSATGITTKNYYDFTGRTMKYTESASGYSHSVGYDYDDINNLISQVETINGTTHTTTYDYDEDNRVTSKTTDGITVNYTYDALGRITQQVTKNGSNTILTENYTYTANSSQIHTYRTVSSGYDVTYTYTYDDNGNILSVNDGTYTTSYVYDSQNQLIRENNQAGGFAHVWAYDNAGNIQSRTEYAYTEGTLENVTPTDTVLYGYGEEDANWRDQLLSYDGIAIEYDKIGNPESYRGKTLTWEHGRELAMLSDGTTIWTYTYDASGMRTKRTNGTNTYSYVYNGSQLVQMTVGENTLYFTYDSAGIPATVTYNGTVYYYTTNVQGDITGILKSDGTQVVTYTYDAWGNPLSCTGSMADTLGAINPIRYRGYVYDQETGLYYLQNRYYDSEIGRFINEDGYTVTGQGLLGNNMFVYCGNNPVTRKDSQGNRYCAATTVSGENSYDRKYACYWQKQVVLEKYNPKPIGQTQCGKVYLVKKVSEVRTAFPGDVIVLDNRGNGPDDNVEIQLSFLISSKELQRNILTILYEFEVNNPTGWNRTVDSMMIEWEIHNEGAFLGSLIPFGGKLYTKSIHACFDNDSEGWSKWDHYIDGAKKVFG